MLLPRRVLAKITCVPSSIPPLNIVYTRSHVDLEECVRNLIPAYLETLNYEPGGVNGTNIFFVYPFLKAIQKNFPRIVFLLAEKLPEGITVESVGESRFFIRTSVWKSFGLIECSIWYRRPLVLQELLKVPHCAEYARTNAGNLALCALKAGSLKMARTLMEDKDLTLYHLHFALEYCNNEDCKELLNSLLSKHELQHILDYQDQEGNTLLHLVALYGRKRFLLDLAQLGIFDLSESEQRHRLLRKNKSGYSPFVVAVLMNHFDISSALFVVPEGVQEIGEEEIWAIGHPWSLVKTLTQFLSPDVYPTEAELWDKILPRKKEIMKVVAKFQQLDNIGKFPSLSEYIYKQSKKEQKQDDYIFAPASPQNLLSHLLALMEAGKVMQTLSYILFRRDLLYVTTLLLSPAELRVNVLETFRYSVLMPPFFYVLHMIGVGPNDKDELDHVLNINEIYTEKFVLLMMEHFNIIGNNSAEDEENVKKSNELLFTKPYTFFMGKSPLEMRGGIKFDIDELSLLVPFKIRAQKKHLHLSLAGWAIKFANEGHFKVFITIAAYGAKYSPRIIDRILVNINAEELILTMFKDYPQELPALIKILPSRFMFNYDIMTMKLSFEGINIVLPNVHSSIANLLYFAIVYSGKLLLENNDASPVTIIKSVLHSIVHDMLKLFRAMFEVQMQDNVRPGITFNDAKRSFRMFYDIVADALKQVNRKTRLMEIVDAVPSQPVITDSKLAELIIEVLNIFDTTFCSYNTFINFNLATDKSQLLDVAAAISRTKACSLSEAAALLFTEDYFFGLTEFKSVSTEYFLSVNFKFFSDPRSPPLSYSITAVYRGRSEITFLSSKKVRREKAVRIISKEDECYEVNMELMVNLDGSQLGKVGESYVRLNEDVHREIVARTLDQQKPVTVLTMNDSNVTFLLDKNSAIENMEELEQLYPIDTFNHLRNTCRLKLGHLLDKISFLYTDFKLLSPSSRKMSKIKPPDSIKELIKEKVERKSISKYVIVVVKEEKWNKLRQPLITRILDAFRQPSPAQLELSFILPAHSELAGKLAEDLHPEYLLGRVAKAEIGLVKQLLCAFEENAPFLRVDMKSFVEKIAAPIAKVGGSSKYSNPLVVVEDVFSRSQMLLVALTEIMVHMNSIVRTFKYNITAIFVLFEKEEGIRASKEAETYPLVDKLANLVDCRIKGSGPMCVVTLVYADFWPAKKLSAILQAPATGNSDSARASIVAHLQPLTHRMKVLEALITESELLAKYLYRKENDLKAFGQSLSSIFGKSIKAIIDWQSLYVYLRKAIKKKSEFKNLVEYYDYVFVCCME